mmetsp:Transcript_8118/g.17594  ORF Transcript_8118/g.17594 Transcript_8118/m.17594 type:complete len:227 (+) Transcript_8118:96-776(+)
MASAAAATSGARVRRNNNHNKHNNERPILISPRFVAAEPTTLVFKEKRTGDSKNVRDASGDVAFEVDPRHLTLSKRRILKDEKGVPVGQMRQPRTQISDTKWYFGIPGNPGVDKRGNIQHKGPGAPDPDHVHAEIFLSPQFALGGMEDHLIGKVEGNWRSRECRISVFRESARVVRGAGVPEAADSYLVEVAAGMDVAFVTMIVLALNEIYSGDDEGDDEETLLME